jgi:hypothetical protein
MSNTFEVKVDFDPAKYSPDFQRIGRAESVVVALNRALQQAHIELRLAKKAQKDASPSQSVTL